MTDDKDTIPSPATEFAELVGQLLSPLRDQIKSLESKIDGLRDGLETHVREENERFLSIEKRLPTLHPAANGADD